MPWTEKDGLPHPSAHKFIWKYLKWKTISLTRRSAQWSQSWLLRTRDYRICHLVLANLTVVFPGRSAVRNLPTTQETQVQSLGQEEFPGDGNGNPLQYSCLGNPMDRGAWRAAVHGVTKSQTQLSIYTHTCNLTVAIGKTICLWYANIKTVHLK